MKVFIQARMTSERYPKKVLEEIFNKKSTLEIIMDKLSAIVKKKIFQNQKLNKKYFS